MLYALDVPPTLLNSIGLVLTCLIAVMVSFLEQTPSLPFCRPINSCRYFGYFKSRSRTVLVIYSQLISNLPMRVVGCWLYWQRKLSLLYRTNHTIYSHTVMPVLAPRIVELIFNQQR